MQENVSKPGAVAALVSAAILSFLLRAPRDAEKTENQSLSRVKSKVDGSGRKTSMGPREDSDSLPFVHKKKRKGSERIPNAKTCQDSSRLSRGATDPLLVSAMGSDFG